MAANDDPLAAMNAKDVLKTYTEILNYLTNQSQLIKKRVVDVEVAMMQSFYNGCFDHSEHPIEREAEWLNQAPNPWQALELSRKVEENVTKLISAAADEARNELLNWCKIHEQDREVEQCAYQFRMLRNLMEHGESDAAD